MRQVFNFILDQIFPQDCISCGVRDQQFCEACIHSMQYFPQWTKLHNVEVWSAYPYNQYICERVMELWKYRGAAEIIKRFYAQIQFPDFVNYDALIPVPLHQKKLVQRGFNQSAILAELLSYSSGVPVICILKRLRNTGAQAGLHRQERLDNLRKAFTLSTRADIEGKRVLIIDDVVSTGSTIYECADVLYNAGVQEVKGVCLFRGGADSLRF